MSNGYSTERKQAVLRKLLPPLKRTVADLAKEEGVSTAAIYQWRKAAQAKASCYPRIAPSPMCIPVKGDLGSG